MFKLKFLALGCILAALASTLLPLQAQTSDADIKAVTDAIQTLQDQQKTIAANQDKIDDKLASIGQSVHDARLYAARVK